MTKFFNRVHDVNLSTYYILPLLVLSKSRYGKSFINSYLTRDHKQIVVEAKEPIEEYHLQNYLNFYGDLEDHRETYGGRIYITYNIPEKWAADIQLFTEGRYSQFSQEAKNLIIEQSGLSYKRINGQGQPVTDARLIAIEDDEKSRATLRRVMEEFLGTSLPEDAELLSVPGERNFIDSAQELIKSPAELV